MLREREIRVWPRWSTLSKKLGVDPAFLVSNTFSDKQLIVIKKLLDFIGLLSQIPPEKHQEFAEHFLQLIHILDKGEATHESQGVQR